MADSTKLTYISNFSFICKKDNVENENVYKYICSDLYNGDIEDFSTYMFTIANFTGKIENFLNSSSSITHISPLTEAQIIRACNEFSSSDEYGLLHIILPKRDNMHYTDKDCKKIRDIVESVLHIKYTYKEYINEQL